MASYQQLIQLQQAYQKALLRSSLVFSLENFSPTLVNEVISARRNAWIALREETDALLASFSLPNYAASLILSNDNIFIPDGVLPVCVRDAYHGIRFYDGAYFGELRVYADKIELVADKTYTFELDCTVPHTYRVTGKNNDVKLYIDEQLAIDGTGKFIQRTALKAVEFGGIADRSTTFSSTWSSFKLTTSGDYLPENTEDVLLEQVIAFPGNSANRMQSYKDCLYVAATPADPDKSSSLYRFEKTSDADLRSTVAVTRSNVSAVIIDPNRQLSPFGASGKYVGTDSGLQYVFGSKPEPFDHVAAIDNLENTDWKLESNCNSCAEIINNVLKIDTTPTTSPTVHKYKQNLPLDPWVANASSGTGWTVEARVKIVDDGSGGTFDKRSAMVSGKCPGETVEEDGIEAPGILLNDGKYQEVVQFFQKGIRLKYAKLFASQTLDNQFYTIRIIAKNKGIAVYAKGDNEPVFKKLIYAPDALFVEAKVEATQEKPCVFLDANDRVHVVWQEPTLQGTDIYYNFVAPSTIANGSGLIGSKKYDPTNSIIVARIGFGLPPAADLDYSAVPKNNLICPSGMFKTDNIKAGDVLRIVVEDGTFSDYKIRKVLDEVLLELDTSDDLSEVGPAEWSILNGEAKWGQPSKVSDGVMDSSNPRAIAHSNGSAFVVYDSNANGTSTIILKRGLAGLKGIEWSDAVPVANISRTCRNPDVIELVDGNLLVVWESAFNGSSFISYAIVNPSTLVISDPVNLVATTAVHARNPRVAANVNGATERVIVAFEDDSDTEGKFEIFAARMSRKTGDKKFVEADPTKLSAAFGQTRHPSISNALTVVWEEEVAENKTEIACATFSTFNGNWNAIRLTDSRNNCRNPEILSDNSVVYESDRVRKGYPELYLSRLGWYRLPTGLAFDSSTGVISGSPLESGVFNVGLGAKNANGISTDVLTLTVLESGSVAVGDLQTPTDPDLPLIKSPKTATAVVGKPFSYTVEAINSPTEVSAASIKQCSAGDGLDIKLNAYLAYNSRPSAVRKSNGNFVLAWEGEYEGKHSLFTMEYDGFHVSMERNVVGYFPLNETSGKVVKNRIVDTDPDGSPKNFGAIPFYNGTAGTDLSTYATTPVNSDSSLFSPASDFGFDLNNRTFTIPASPLLAKSGAVDILVRPHWRSDAGSTNVIFGTGAFDSQTNNSILLAYSSGDLSLKIKDTNGVIHSTVASPVWEAESPVHIRSTWDSGDQGLATLNFVAFSPQTTTTAFACAAEGTIVKSTDSGATWTKQTTNITYDLFCIDFLNDSVGYACGEMGTVLTTADGGATWNVIDTGFSVDLKSIFVKAADSIYTVGSNGTILKSVDGTSFTRISIDDLPEAYKSADLYSVAVASNGNIIVVGDKAILKCNFDSDTFTVSGSSTIYWKTVSRTHQLSSYETYISGSSGQVRKTADGGVTWDDVSPVLPEKPAIYAISHAADSDKVFANWTNGFYLSSTDGGTTWASHAISAQSPYLSIDANIGGSGTGSDFLMTANAGKLYKLSGNQLVNVRSSNLTIWINGQEVEQVRTNNEAFSWTPTGNLVFGNDTSGSYTANAVLDEIVVYKTPNPSNASFIRQEFRAYQSIALPLTSESSTKRIEWGAISNAIKCQTLWSSFKLSFCGSKEPIQTFTWDDSSGLCDNFVSDLCLDGNGNLVVATQGGIGLLNLAEASKAMNAFLDNRTQPKRDVPLFSSLTNLANNLLSESVNCITVDNENWIWAGFDGGLGYKKPDAPKFTNLTFAEGLPTGRVLTLKAIGSSIYVGTESGLAIVTKPTDVTKSPTIVVYTSSNGLPSNRIQAIATDTSGQIWLGTNKGIAKFSPNNITVLGTKNGLISRDIVSLLVDSAGRKIAGTGFGISIIDGNNVTSYPPSSGIGTGAIKDSVQDQAGSLWFATSSGLVEMRESCNVKFALYDWRDGIIGDNRIKDYQFYKILGARLPYGGCDKALVTVLVNGDQISEGFTVNPAVPWIVFDTPLSPSDVVNACVYRGWRKVYDFGENSKQATVETGRTVFNLYKKRFKAGAVVLGGNSAIGSNDSSARMYTIFAQSISAEAVPITSVTTPASNTLTSAAIVGTSIYSDTDEGLTMIPTNLSGLQNLAMPSSDSASISTRYAQLTLAHDAIIYVAYDARAGVDIPNWLKDFDPVLSVSRITDMKTFIDGSGTEKLFVATSGTTGCVFDVLNDKQICDVSDSILVDQTPPTGCVTVTRANSDTLYLALTASDAVSGVTEMQVSPRSDFTTDGTTEVPFVPFQTTYPFSIPTTAQTTVGDVANLPDEPTALVFTCAGSFNGDTYFGTKAPGRLYKYDKATNLLTLELETEEAEVTFLATFNNSLFIGTNGNGRVLKWTGSGAPTILTPVGTKASSGAVFNNKLYLGYFPTGEVYGYEETNGVGTMTAFKNTSETDVTGFATFGNKLYWTTANETIAENDVLATTITNDHKHSVTVPAATTLISGLDATTSSEDGHTHAVVDGIVQPGGTDNHTHELNGMRSGKVYRYDPITGNLAIVHSDRDSYATTIVAEEGPGMYIGTYPHGKILKFVQEQDIFAKSFQTPKNKVRVLKYVGNVLYATVDNDIYTKTTGPWMFKASVEDVVAGISPDNSIGTNEVFVAREKILSSTATAPSTLSTKACAFVRFKDAAGNISSITDANGDIIACYNPCYDFATQNGGLTISKNRLVEVDKYAQVVFGIDNSEPFFSGNKVEKEVAVYYSEILNGTSSFVQWTTLSWSATTPAGTTLTVAVKSANSQAELASAEFGTEFSSGTSNDITSYTGRYLQFRVTLQSLVKGAGSPVLHSVDVGVRISQATHFYTTNFTLPEAIKKGILTYNGVINPPITDIVFGINGDQSTDFDDYYIFSPDKMFELPEEFQKKNMKIGIKLISSISEVPVVDEFALLFSLANNATIRLNLDGHPTTTEGQLVSVAGSTTVTTERVQGHAHTITYDSSIVVQTDISGRTSVNAGHFHEVIDGVVQQAAGHTHSFAI
jgi:photosystem II stability/assembly factor-like uncharacterized protein